MKPIHEMSADGIPPRMEIELKFLESGDPDSVRIYRLTAKACERLNNYLLDFYETTAILMENLDRYRKNAETEKVGETIESLNSVKERISEVSRSMEQIAHDMPSLVGIRRHDR